MVRAPRSQLAKGPVLDFTRTWPGATVSDCQTWLQREYSVAFKRSLVQHAMSLARVTVADRFNQSVGLLHHWMDEFRQLNPGSFAHVSTIPSLTPGSPAVFDYAIIAPGYALVSCACTRPSDDIPLLTHLCPVLPAGRRSVVPSSLVV